MSETRLTNASLIAPHGGELVNRYINSPVQLPSKAVTLNARAAADLELLANGAVSPLTGFMQQADYLSVVQSMHLANGLAWSLPITLGVSREEANSFKVGDKILLNLPDGRPAAVLQLQEKFAYDKAAEAQLVYRTDDPAHPGVAALYAQGEILLGGSVEVFAKPAPSVLFAPHYRPPADTRRIFQEKGWQKVVAFQTRNPVHRAHEYIQKSAL